MCTTIYIDTHSFSELAHTLFLLTHTLIKSSIRKWTNRNRWDRFYVFTIWWLRGLGDIFLCVCVGRQTLIIAYIYFMRKLRDDGEHKHSK